MNEKEKQARDAYESLRCIVKPGDILYTILRHVSKSGMTRWIDVYKLEDSQPRFLSFWCSQLLGWPMSDKHQGVKVQGCGMDMGFHLVYNVSSALYRETGYECIEAQDPGQCPAAAHMNERDPAKIPQIHHDGYAISQKWI